ncbi:MAG: chemotaxis protein CheX [Thermovenabulum sp.]|uniref:chemotaxis protein CheX n=1 Tax=Thermovenabulum sp. TaxID=3100335 RepID=UPI003C7AE84F
MNKSDMIISAVNESFFQFGFSDLVVEKTEERDITSSNFPVNVIIGCEGAWNGNIIIGFDKELANFIVKTMTMGMIEDYRDKMGLSAISELCNMFAGAFVNKLSFNGRITLISPPTVIMGDNIKVFLSKVNTTSVLYSSGMGKMEINSGIWEIT